MEIVPYGGWNRCARLVSGDTEMLVTLEVGPRIIRYGLIGGPNELVEYEKDMGKKGGDEYRSYGGHRLWIAPEDQVKTLQPENEAVEQREEEGWAIFTIKPDRFHLQKEIRVKPSEGGFMIEHRIYNRGAYDVELAPWALTVMAPGGECLFPQAPFQPHSENFLPVRPLVLWSYTRMSDPRWTWGDRVVRLRHQDGGDPQKCGALVAQGYAAYANRGNLFLKRFPFDPDALYPDMDCNFETFTRHDMLEVESLGPLQFVEPGGAAVHEEAWYLIPNATPPEDDEQCGDWLEALAADRPLR
jgi:hypothetical protein